MQRRFFLALTVAALVAVAPAHAGQIQYLFTVDTSGFAANTGGFIDVQFNQANIGSLSGVATVNSFNSTGYTFNDAADVFSAPGVSGSFSSLPLTLQNDANATNYYAHAVTSFGSGFTMLVTLSGAVIGGTATDPSAFYLILEDANGAPLFPSLGVGGEVASITVNNDGSTTPAGSTFTGGSATVTIPAETPEPSTLLLSLGGAALLAASRFRRGKA